MPKGNPALLGVSSCGGEVPLITLALLGVSCCGRSGRRAVFNAKQIEPGWVLLSNLALLGASSCNGIMGVPAPGEGVEIGIHIFGLDFRCRPTAAEPQLQFGRMRSTPSGKG